VTARADRYDEYIVVHVGKTEGGFGKRFFMFVDVLRKRRCACIRRPMSALWRILSLRLRGRRACAIVYYDVLAPFVAAARLINPRLTVAYMVRGDQVAWARFQGRALRARTAQILQKWMARLGCVFVFASEDLHMAFMERLGPLPRAHVLPNTVGHPLPPSRPFDGHIGVVGDFRTVKNIEFVLTSLREGRYHVHLFGNRSLPEVWRQPWLESHGVVADLASYLKRCSLVVVSSMSEGFPNVIVEALEAGCGAVLPEGAPFRGLPLHPAWRYQMTPCDGQEGLARDRSLPQVLHRLLAEQRDFRKDNRELYDLIESDWESRIWEIFG